MFNFTKGVRTVLAISALLLMTAAVSFAQTTGSVTMNATVSNFVELTSGGAVTLTGNSGGSVITDGTANSPLAVVVNLGDEPDGAAVRAKPLHRPVERGVSRV